MKTAILGTGIVGRTIATKLTKVGYEVVIGTREVQRTLEKGSRDGSGNTPFQEWYEENHQIPLRTFAEAAQQAEVIFNCMRGQISLLALEAIGEENLTGKVLIDLANPLDFTHGMPPSLSPVNTDSLGEQIQKRFSTLKVVKSLNTMNANIMVSPSIIKGDHNVFVCGNDEGAKAITKDILQSFGWKENLIIDLGDISNARGTEMLLPMWLRLWNTLGTAEFNFHIQRN
ncbi:MAG: NAD(P)-binding domain-containing protein [Bacteroidota bacterium]